jgi:organic radical activating enzyme
MMSTLVVNEVFGPTIQGEGPSTGRRCGFLRLGGCNLSCHWCDTPYTWDWKGISDAGIPYDPRVELTRQETDKVAAQLLALGVDLIVVTGGEPLSQQGRLLPLLEILAGADVRVEIETNGTITPSDRLVASGTRFNVSPKLSHAGDPQHRRIRPEALRRLNGTEGVAFKFVCRSTDDLDEVAQLEKELALNPIWIMPEGRSAEEISHGLAVLADEVVNRGWSLSTRLHVLAWNDKRGV